METLLEIKKKEFETIEFPLHNIYLEGNDIYESEEAYYIGKYELSYELRVDASYVTCTGDYHTPGTIELQDQDIMVGNIKFGFRQDDAFELTDEQYETVKNKIIKSLNII